MHNVNQNNESDPTVTTMMSLAAAWQKQAKAARDYNDNINTLREAVNTLRQNCEQHIANLDRAASTIRRLQTSVERTLNL